MAQQSFDYIDFSLAFSEIKVKLAELKWIDDSMEILRAQNDVIFSDNPEELYPDGAAIHPVVYTLGTTYPFEYVVDFWAPDLSDKRRVDEDLAAVAQQATSTVYPRMSALLEDNQKLIKPFAGDFEDAANRVVSELSQVIEDDVPLDLGKFGGSLSRWQGNAALSFDRNFVGPFQEVREAQRLAVARLAVCLSTAKGIVDCGQQSLMNAVATVKTIVDDQLQQRHDSRTPSGVSGETVALVGSTISLIGGAAALTGAGAAPGAVAGVVGGGISYAAGFLPDEASDKRGIDVVSAEDTLSALEDEFFSTRVSALQMWNRFRLEDIEPVTSAVQAAEEEGRLFPPQPHLRGVGPNDFHHESSDQY